MAAEACTQGLDTGFIELGVAKVAALGVVQGISELLPISSTAHMRIVPALLGWRDPGLGLFRRHADGRARRRDLLFLERCRQVWSSARSRAIGRRDFRDWQFRFTSWILLATLPLVVFGVLLSKTLNTCGSPLRSLYVIGAACIVMSLLLALAEKFCAHRRTLDNVSLKDAMLVGLAQVGALIPGVSRSGSTLTAALFLDLKREEAARFSFLLGLPAIFLAGVKEFYELYKAHLPLDGWMILGVGLVVASISAFVAIWGLMRIWSGSRPGSSWSIAS